uniref:ATP synthase subunit a n=1 Tax=Neoasterolepisma foreli TaxID=2779710 RepID=A0A7L9R540_9INSE|nr:ATP synthase F0 subunit 6 [Neoasterolepisma foreli]QOL10505.1 ATP synthase F0 subunit 6 [Neoasterolepisma foreli]
MTSLFSSFDPTSSIMNLSLNWLSTFLGLLVIPMPFWLMQSRISYMYNMIMNKLHTEFKNFLGPMNHQGSTLLFISLFSMILFNNFMGLFPYIFTSSSHLVFTLTLALPMWMSFMLYGWINNTKHMLAHLVPEGVPAMLMPIMVCIEMVSNLIRPMTLSVRLAANMMVGHLVLSMIGNAGSSLEIIGLIMLLSAQMLLVIMESAVAIIQSYVFALLVAIYSSESK